MQPLTQGEVRHSSQASGKALLKEAASRLGLEEREELAGA